MKACIFANYMSEQCMEKTKELVQQLYSCLLYTSLQTDVEPGGWYRAR